MLVQTSDDGHTFDDSPQSYVTKKRFELAKFLIGNFKDENEKRSSEPATRTATLSSTASVHHRSSLSADLQSRLHFNNSSSTSSSSIAQPVVKFNEDSLRSKVVVSSTTKDDDDNSLCANNSKLKRKLTSHEEDQDDDDQKK